MNKCLAKSEGRISRLTWRLAFILASSLRRRLRLFIFCLIARSLGAVPHSGSRKADVVEIASFTGAAASVAGDILLPHMAIFARMATVALRKIKA